MRMFGALSNNCSQKCIIISPSHFRYLKIHGFKFSKEDHISLINLLMSVLNIPDLEPWLVNKTACILTSLMKRKELLTQADLTVEWKPLYKLFERLLYSPFEALGMMSFPP